MVILKENTFVEFGKKIVSVSSVVLFFSVLGCKVKTPPANEDLQKEAFTHFVLPSEWKGAKGDGSVDTSQIAQNWVGNFNDPVLDSLVSEGLRYNSDLLVSSTRIEQAAGYVNMSKAALRPTLNVLGRGGTKMGEDFSLGLSGGLISASWEIDLWGKLRNARSASIAGYQAVQEDYKAAQFSIAGSIVRSWYDATEIYLEEQLVKEMIATNTKLANLAKKRFDIGIGNQIDYELAIANLNSTNDAQKKLQQAYNNQLRALEVLVGRYPSAEIEVNKTLVSINGKVPAGIPMQILERRPDLRAAEKRFAVAFHGVEAAKASRLPNVKLTGSFGVITSTVLQLRPDFQNPTGGVSAVGAMPIYQGGAIKASIEIKTAEQKQAVAEYGRAVLNAISDVENSLEAIQTLDDRENYLNLAVKSNEKAFVLEQQLYDVGKTDMRSVSQQQLGLYASKITLLRLQSEKISQRVSLYLALGGTL
ncbi:efflux transporter outer membrane subunit [Flavobacterium sp. ABG]|uniref:efflux transporter outer membrane subunit n=1 Tax=Flavobacterium sp. ABG TaxID=1423322 RepID=UPI00064B2980|nr:efflux transporter outer membrane subunit [Flavobacterium sp. ABG]KLT69405.1 hypothetical protein AB674_12160 [Flavobacterium sp. ABG]